MNCLKAEDFEQKAHRMLDWLTEAERHLRYQGTMPESEEVLEQQLADHQVSSSVSVALFTSLYLSHYLLFTCSCTSGQVVTLDFTDRGSVLDHVEVSHPRCSQPTWL